MMNFMIIRGFADKGHSALAHRITSDTIRMISDAGFYEYFDPLSGVGLGGNDFTWTAAIELLLDGD